MQQGSAAKAAVGGIELGPGGVAFELTRAARTETRTEIGTWTVKTVPGLRLIVASGRVSTYRTALRAALERTEMAIDLLSVRGIDDLGLSDPLREHVAWWTESRGLIIRIASIPAQPLPTISLRGEVRDAKGRLVHSPKPPAPRWNESYRFFRLSQTTTDLFDAYRNAYLALESLLSVVGPQRVRAPGVRGEKDRDWFKRALRATGVDLASFVDARSSDPANDLYRELYIGVRVRTFHSKVHRGPLLPRTEAARAAVERGLDVTRRLYLAIVEAKLGSSRLRGGFSTYAARRMAAAVFDPLDFYVSADESPLAPDAEAVSPPGIPHARLEHMNAADHNVPFEVRRLGWSEVAKLRDMPFVRVAIGANAGQPYVATRLEGQLVLGSAARLEVELGATFHNIHDLRGRYL